MLLYLFWNDTQRLQKAAEDIINKIVINSPVSCNNFTYKSITFVLSPCFAYRYFAYEVFIYIVIIYI